MDSNDQTLLNQWYQHGDAEAFHQITRRYAGLVYGTCRRILCNPSDAEDVAQECFETLAVKTRADGRALGAWLHTVATRRALDRIKTESRRREREHRAYAAQPAQDTTEWDDIYAFVDESIASLPEKERVPLVAHFLEGQTHAEIAERMGISRPTAGYRIQQGLERIRKDLKRRNITTTNASLGAALGAGLAAEAAPATLIAVLGKISVSSLPAMANTATPLITTTIAGSILMKKALIAGAVIAAVAGGTGLFLRNHSAAPVPPPVIALPANESETVAEAPEPRAPEAESVAAATPEIAAESPPETPPSAPLAFAPGNGEIPDSSDAGLGDLAIAGRVVDESEKPIKGVFIQIFGQGGNPHIRTNDDGTFRLTGLAAGSYTGHASHDRYSDQGLSPMEAGDENVLIVLQGRAVVSGRVVDASTGSPVTDFSISSQDGIASKIESGITREQHSVSDPRGHFELSSVETGPSTIIVQAAGYATTFTPLELESAEAVKDVEIALQAGILVQGRVRDSAGNPVAGAWIFTETPPPVAALKQISEGAAERIEEALASGVINGTSGADGVFSLDTLSYDNRTEALHAYHPKHGSGKATLDWDRMTQPTGGKSQLSEVDIILENSVGAAEILVTVDGKPAEGSAVLATASGGHGTSFQRGTTGPDGRATLADLPEGLLGITAIYPGQQEYTRRITADTSIETGKTAQVSIDFTPATASLEGVVRLGDQPAVGGFLTLQLAEGERAESYRENLNADGTFSFEGVSAGDAMLQINAVFGEAPRSKTMSVTLVEGERQQLEIDMAGGGNVQGVVAGIPAAAHCSVFALRGEQVIEEVTLALMSTLEELLEGSAQVEADGAYFIEGVSPGHHTLLVLVTKTRGPDAFDDAKFVTAVVDVVDGETTSADFDVSE